MEYDMTNLSNSQGFITFSEFYKVIKALGLSKGINQ